MRLGLQVALEILEEKVKEISDKKLAELFEIMKVEKLRRYYEKHPEEKARMEQLENNYRIMHPEAIYKEVNKINDSSNKVSNIQTSFINILLKNHNMLKKFYEEYGYLFFDGQDGVQGNDRLKYIIAQIDIEELMFWVDMKFL